MFGMLKHKSCNNQTPGKKKENAPLHWFYDWL